MTVFISLKYVPRGDVAGYYGDCASFSNYPTELKSVSIIL